MNIYYKMDGTPYDGTNYEILMQWAKDFASPDRILKNETLENGYRVSTIWSGLDHSYGSGKPLIFETMVFSKEDHADLDCERYSTKEEALKGHDEMAKKWKNKRIT